VPRGNGKALWSMIIGIIAVPLGCLGCLGLIGIASIVMGGQAKREIAASGGMQTGAGQAKAGVILGWMGVAFGTISLILAVILVSRGYNLDTGSFNS